MSQDHTAVTHPDGAHPVAQPDPEVAPRAKRHGYAGFDPAAPGMPPRGRPGGNGEGERDAGRSGRESLRVPRRGAGRDACSVPRLRLELGE